MFLLSTSLLPTGNLVRLLVDLSSNLREILRFAAEHRMQQLQLWVDRMCRHPVLSQSAVWHHFLTCGDEKQWKVGKRKAEKDELQGANFFNAIQVRRRTSFLRCLYPAKKKKNGKFVSEGRTTRSGLVLIVSALNRQIYRLLYTPSV